MRLLVVNPNTSQEMTQSIEACARGYARPDTEIVAMNPEKGPASIEGFFDDAVAVEATLDLLIQQRGKFDAYIIACGADSGVFAAREIMEAPVVGIGEAGMLTACMLGYRFSILDALHREWPQMIDLVHRYGMKDRCASIRTLGMTVLETETKTGNVLHRLLEEARKAIEQDRAEVIVLGCAGMSGLDKEMEKSLGVPVLDGVVCAVKMAEGLVDYGVTTSKASAFRHPEPKVFKNCSEGFTSVGMGPGAISRPTNDQD
jgi:allantoin racemase